jgi:hypothetical protein
VVLRKRHHRRPAQPQPPAELPGLAFAGSEG